MCHYSQPTIASSNHASSSKAIECIICFTPVTNSYGTGACTHAVCRRCVRDYFNGALNDVRYKTYDCIQCPSLKCASSYAVTDAFLLKFFTAAEADNWWISALTKSFIVNKVYCPMEGCGGVFDVDEKFTKECTFTECYECHRGFCIPCEKPWHPNKTFVFDDLEAAEQTLVYAKQSMWMKCPSCKYIVEKRQGCNDILCRCGVHFCYRCGSSQCICASSSSALVDDLRNKIFTLDTSL